MRSFDHLGRSSEAKDCKNPKKEVWWTDGPPDEPAKRGVESCSTRLKIIKKKCDRPTNGWTNGQTDGRTDRPMDGWTKRGVERMHATKDYLHHNASYQGSLKRKIPIRWLLL